MKPNLLPFVALPLLATLPSAQHPWRVGQPLPELRLPDVSGTRTVDLASFRGKRLVLFEFASW